MVNAQWKLLNIFFSDPPLRTVIMMSNFSCTFRRVTEKDNFELRKIPALDEVTKTVMDMDEDSSPGSDVFSSKHWCGCH